MPHDERPQLRQHIQLLVKVALEQTLVRAAGQLSGLFIHRPVIVNRNGQRMMHGSYEELEWEPREALLDQGP